MPKKQKTKLTMSTGEILGHLRWAQMEVAGACGDFEAGRIRMTLVRMETVRTMLDRIYFQIGNDFERISALREVARLELKAGKPSPRRSR